MTLAKDEMRELNSNMIGAGGKEPWRIDAAMDIREMLLAEIDVLRKKLERLTILEETHALRYATLKNPSNKSDPQ